MSFCPASQNCVVPASVSLFVSSTRKEHSQPPGMVNLVHMLGLRGPQKARKKNLQVLSVELFQRPALNGGEGHQIE